MIVENEMSTQIVLVWYQTILSRDRLTHAERPRLTCCYLLVMHLVHINLPFLKLEWLLLPTAQSVCSL